MPSCRWAFFRTPCRRHVPENHHQRTNALPGHPGRGGQPKSSSGQAAALPGTDFLGNLVVALRESCTAFSRQGCPPVLWRLVRGGSLLSKMFCSLCLNQAPRLLPFLATHVNQQGSRCAQTSFVGLAVQSRTPCALEMHGCDIDDRRKRNFVLRLDSTLYSLFAWCSVAVPLPTGGQLGRSSTFFNTDMQQYAASVYCSP